MILLIAALEFFALIVLGLWAWHIKRDGEKSVDDLIKERTDLATLVGDMTARLKGETERAVIAEEQLKVRGVRIIRSNPNRLMRYLEAVDPANVEADSGRRKN